MCIQERMLIIRYVFAIITNFIVIVTFDAIIAFAKKIKVLKMLIFTTHQISIYTKIIYYHCFKAILLQKQFSINFFCYKI